MLLWLLISLAAVQHSEGQCGWWTSPINCQWHDWSTWGSCSHTCGKLRNNSFSHTFCCCFMTINKQNTNTSGNAGTQIRYRSIRTYASCGGSECSGSSSETRACNRQPPINCQWHDWSTWGSCSHTCGKLRNNSFFLILFVNVSLLLINRIQLFQEMLEPRAAPDQFSPTLFVVEVGAVDQTLTPVPVTDFVIMEEPLSLLAVNVPVHIGGAVVKIVSSNFHLRVKFSCGILKSSNTCPIHVRYLSEYVCVCAHLFL